MACKLRYLSGGGNGGGGVTLGEWLPWEPDAADTVVDNGRATFAYDSATKRHTISLALSTAREDGVSEMPRKYRNLEDFPGVPSDFSWDTHFLDFDIEVINLNPTSPFRDGPCIFVADSAFAQGVGCAVVSQSASIRDIGLSYTTSFFIANNTANYDAQVSTLRRLDDNLFGYLIRYAGAAEGITLVSSGIPGVDSFDLANLRLGIGAVVDTASEILAHDLVFRAFYRVGKCDRHNNLAQLQAL